MKNFLCVLIIFFSVFCLVKPTFADWEEDRKYQSYVDDFALNPGEEKEVTIKSSERLQVGFKTDISSEDYEKYKNAENPIILSQKNRANSISSIYGGSMPFKPVDGKIILQVKNRTKKDRIKVLIYKEKLQ
jgi:hypothetical protein